MDNNLRDIDLFDATAQEHLYATWCWAEDTRTYWAQGTWICWRGGF